VSLWRILRSIFGIGMLVFALSIAAGVGEFHALSVDAVPFSRESWQRLRPQVDADPDPGCVLGGMAAGLIAEQLMNGRSAAGVRAELGSPSRVHNAQLIYDLGQCHGFGWHHSELVLHVGSSGMVSKAQTRRK
jgi:hypothetical protein